MAQSCSISFGLELRLDDGASADPHIIMMLRGEGTSNPHPHHTMPRLAVELGVTFQLCGAMCRSVQNFP